MQYKPKNIVAADYKEKSEKFPKMWCIFYNGHVDLEVFLLVHTRKNTFKCTHLHFIENAPPFGNFFQLVHLGNCSWYYFWVKYPLI